MDQNMRAVCDEISALLEGMIEKLIPSECDNPDCDHHHDQIPDGPWLISGWALAVDISAEGKGEDKDDEVQTYTSIWRSSGLPRTQCLGLGQSIVSYAAG